MSGQAQDGLSFEILIDGLPAYVTMASDPDSQSDGDAESAMARLRDLLGSVDGGEHIVVTSPLSVGTEPNGLDTSADLAAGADLTRRRARRLIADLEEMKPSLPRGI